MPRRHYSDEERAAALAALRANGGNVSRTARQVGVPRVTLQHWALGETHGPPPKVGQQKKADLAERFEQIGRDLLDRVNPELIEAANLQQVLTSAGIAIDKMRLLRNEPTEITAQLVLVEQIRDPDDYPDHRTNAEAARLP